MNTKNNVFKITGKVQHYQWGGFNYIPMLLDVSNTEHQPFAEYWLGAHENAPSTINSGEKLDQLIKENPDYLGQQTKQAFGRLPYLLKILDVKDMLSIQVHPDKKSAVKEFADENKKGTPLSAANRNYKDDNHKPELMTALSEFWLLHGFQNADKLVATVKQIPEFSFMLPVFENNNYKALYELVMTMDQQKINSILQPLLHRIIPLYHNNKLPKDSPDFWAARAALTFAEDNNIDRGIFSIYLLNVLHLKKGEAVFQGAGVLHAYLEGQNVEIMANSDNVLRGGLTPKHVDVAELMKHVVFDPVTPNVISGRSVSETEDVFKTPAKDFELSKITINKDQTYTQDIHTTDIFFVLSGTVAAGERDNLQDFEKGQAFAAVNNTSLVIKTSAAAEIYRATVPLKG